MSSMNCPLDRRAMLQLGAGAIGIALLGNASKAPSPTPSPIPVLSGMIIAHVRVVLGAHADVWLAHFDATAQLTPGNVVAQPTALGLPSRIAGQMADACRHARSEAIQAIARSWAVAPVDCTATGTMIAHPASGRSITYRVWAEIALPDADTSYVLEREASGFRGVSGTNGGRGDKLVG